MRIHFTESHEQPAAIAYAALTECQAAGTIAGHVGFKTLTVHRGGPGFAYALEIQLEAHARDRGRRAGNSGSYGAMRPEYDGFAYALEIQLEAHARDRGRRAGNSGSYGAMRPEYDGYAATYDEWGFFLAALYRMDEGARVASSFLRGNAVYFDAADFHEKTGRTYDPSYPDYVERYGDDYGYRQGRGYKGRRGAGRVHYDSSATRWAVEDERTADFLRNLQAGRVF